MQQAAFYRADRLELARFVDEGRTLVAYWADWSRYGLGFGLIERTKAGGLVGPTDRAETREEAESYLQRMAADLNSLSAVGAI